MLKIHKLNLVKGLLTFVLLAIGFQAFAQGLPNPYRTVPAWAKLPDGRQMGAVGDVAVDPDGKHIWAVVRCDAPRANFGYECVDSDLDPILKFDPEGNLVESFGAGLFIWPHGMDIDDDGNVWVTEAVRRDRLPAGDPRAHQVIKFSSAGEVLMVLGTPGEEGGADTQFTSPSDVVIGDNGDIFVADGHNVDGNNRVMKFASDGTFIKSWGKTGYGPGEFRALHTIAIDNEGRVFVGDRSNSRTQIFTQDGEYLATWTQFGRPSGISFDENGNVFVADSESDNIENPGWEMGIRIGDAVTGWVNYFVLLPYGNPHVVSGVGAEFVAVDAEGNMYGGEPMGRNIQKYIRVRP
mgnify:CR=1 FL=1